MTLIAAWKEGDIPILIGDIVVSSENPIVQSNHPLPTRDDLDKLLSASSGRHFVRPRRKIYKISDSFVVGFAGEVGSAQDVVISVLSHFENKSPSLADIRAYFTNSFGYKVPPCTIIGWLADNGSFSCFRWRSDKPSQFDLGDHYVEGTGSVAFASLYLNRIPVISETQIGTALAMIANLVKEEVLYGNNLPHFFGGGFNIIYWDERKFVIVPSVTFVFLETRETDDPSKLEHKRPQRFLKFHQNGPIMETMVVHLNDRVFTTDVANATSLATHEMYYTFPVTADVGDNFVVNSNLSLRSEYYCIATDIRLRDKPPGFRNDQFLTLSLARVVTDANRLGLLSVDNQPGNIEGFALEDAFFQELFKALKVLDRNQFKRRHKRSRNRRQMP